MSEVPPQALQGAAVAESAEHDPGEVGVVGAPPPPPRQALGALNPGPWTLDPQPSTLNPGPSALNPQPSTLNPKLQPVKIGALAPPAGALTDLALAANQFKARP